MPTLHPQQFELVPCENCRSTRFSTIRNAEEGSKIVRCLDCGLEFVNPLPTEEWLKQLYAQELANGDQKLPFYQNYIQERKDRGNSFDKLHNSRLALIERFCKRPATNDGKTPASSARGSLLDVGCGAGFFLKTAQARGWNPHGIDFLPEYNRFAKEELRLENIHSSTLEEMNYPPLSFDVVTLWDLIEHLRHPLSTLKEINRILRPGGLVAIWTPNVKNAALLKDRWDGYRVPLHLYFLSNQALNNLLTQSGFQTVYEKTTKSKKGFFPRADAIPYRKPSQTPTRFQKIKHSVKRDFTNFINPVNYISPLLDQLGYGFNLFVIAVKQNRPNG
jgi:2-polyprenyl-3-methyl-5-hydroxy-6-metoxy-1,4-benzoquinol methylase